MKRWTGLPFHSISTLQIRARQPALRPGQGTDAPVERTWNLRPSESSIHLNFGSLPGLSTTLTVTGVIFAPKESHDHMKLESCPPGTAAQSWLFRPKFWQVTIYARGIMSSQRRDRYAPCAILCHNRSAHSCRGFHKVRIPLLKLSRRVVWCHQVTSQLASQRLLID